MFKLSNETKIGILAIAAIALAIFGFKYLKGINVLKTSRTFKVRYENVDQLRTSAPVFVSGLQVGMVKQLYVDPKDGKTIIAELNIDADVDIPKDAVATIVGLTLMGGKAIRLDNTHPCEGDGCARSGDFLTGSQESFIGTLVGDPAQLDPYFERLRTGLEEQTYEVLGLKVPHIELYVRPGRDMARLVEVAALTQALKRMGHDPAKDFNDRLISFMTQQSTVATKPIKPIEREERRTT